MTYPEGQPNPWSREGQWASQPAGYQPAYYPPPPPAPPPPKPRRRVGVWVAVGVLGAALATLAIWGAIEESRPAANSGGSTVTSTSGQGSVVSGETKVVTASDKKSQLTVPTAWRDAPASFKNELATIQLGDLRREQYVMVISADTTDFEDFSAFSKAVLDEAESVADSGTKVGDQRTLKIGGLNAVQFEVAGKVEGIKIAYWFTVVEGKRGFYEVVGWTLPSKKAEAEPAIRTVIESFRELASG